MGLRVGISSKASWLIVLEVKGQGLDYLFFESDGWISNARVGKGRVSLR